MTVVSSSVAPTRHQQHVAERNPKEPDIPEQGSTGPTLTRGGDMKHAICCGFAVALITGCGPTGSRRSEVPTPDDQVSVGYGTMRKRDVTAAVTSVSPTEAEAPVTRIQDRLQARVPGLEVLPLANGPFTLRLRGRHSISG